MTIKNIYPWGDFEMDDNTGLPAVPEGFFFRVCRVFGGYWRVELRRKRTGWFSKLEGSRTNGTGRAMTKHTVLRGAAHALTKYREREVRRHDFTLLGDYPPKKLP